MTSPRPFAVRVRELARGGLSERAVIRSLREEGYRFGSRVIRSTYDLYAPEAAAAYVRELPWYRGLPGARPNIQRIPRSVSLHEPGMLHVYRLIVELPGGESEPMTVSYYGDAPEGIDLAMPKLTAMAEGYGRRIVASQLTHILRS